MIESMNNQQIKNIIQLQKKAKVRNSQDVFVVEGPKMVYEAPQNDLVKIYLSETFYSEGLKSSTRPWEGRDYEVVTDKVFKEMSDTQTPQGILAVVKQKKYRLETVIGQGMPLLLILESIQDPGNLGTIIRTAEGAGVSGIVMNKGTVDIYNPKTIRSTMGSIYRMPFIYAEDFYDTIQILKEKGIYLYAAHLGGEKDYNDADYTIRCGFLIGNEGRGLDSQTAATADEYIKIPMSGSVESLNAAVAAALLSYEARQQRNKS